MVTPRVPIVVDKLTVLDKSFGVFICVLVQLHGHAVYLFTELRLENGLDARFAQNSTLRRKSCGIRAFHKRSFAQVIVYETANAGRSCFKTLFQNPSKRQSPNEPLVSVLF